MADGTHVGGSARHEIKAVSHAGEFDIRSTSGMETIDHVNEIVALFRPDVGIGKARTYHGGAEKSLGSKAPSGFEAKLKALIIVSDDEGRN